jgi:hypothetical protein
MNNPVTYFEIPVSDLDRAIVFYTAVFGYELDRTEIDGNAMALFPFTEGASGITGALAQGSSYTPGRASARLYFRTDSIDETLQRAEAAGGRILYPKTDVGENGWVAEFEDSEGNCIALSEV